MAFPFFILFARGNFGDTGSAHQDDELRRGIASG